MTFLGALETRLRSSDMVQLLTLFLAGLVFVGLVRWPTLQQITNEAWFSFAQTRIALLSLLALGYGSVYAALAPAGRRITLAALLVFALLSVPLDVATYAASVPSTPLWWSLVLPFVETVAFYGLGLAFGALVGFLRLRSLLPLLVPGLLVGMVATDVFLGLNLVSPIAASVTVAPFHLALMAVLALGTLARLYRRRQP